MPVEPDKYTQDELKKIKRDYLRECQPKMYRELRRDGELEEYLASRANSARKVAHNFMRTGTHSGQAWSWAIRTELLDSEMD